MRDVESARQMRAAGASYKSIAAHFGVANATVMYALDPEFAARERARAKKNHHGRKRGYKVTGAMLRRMIELAEAGLSYEDIARALAVYHGRSITAATVKKYVREHAPQIRPRPRGNAFGSERDPRLVTT